jgi:hypothetical protein
MKINICKKLIINVNEFLWLSKLFKNEVLSLETDLQLAMPKYMHYLLS